jgi:hypothetical protein
MLVLAVSLVAAACGGGSSKKSGQASGPTTTEVPPQPGGVITSGEFIEPAGLDPIVSTGHLTTGFVEMAAVYDTLLRSLHTAVRAALFLSAIVVIAVFFAGPSRFSVWFRIRVRQGANWVGVQSDQAGWQWLAPNAFVVKRKRGLRIVVAVLAFLVLFRWDHPTPLVIFDIAVVTVLVLGII